MPDLHELLATVQRFMAENYPALTPRRLTIETFEDAEAIRLPLRGTTAGLAPVAAAQPASEAVASGEDEGRGRMHSKCIDDILEVVEAAKGVPLTTTRIMSALSRAGKEWSDRYVAGFLAKMVADGTLDNPPDARPRGYRIPRDETEEPSR